MPLSEISLMGNVKHNTEEFYKRAKVWTQKKFNSLNNRVDVLSHQKSKSSVKKLEKIAKENNIIVPANLSKNRLVLKLKSYLRRRQSNPPVI